MKVISLMEPYATLIKLGHKKIETRSWKTSYRGELYIHASKQQMPLEGQKLQSILSREELSFGKIICKCQLVDCIKMDQKFLSIMDPNSKEFQTGIYQEGRYAWMLENIEPLESPISARGSLNIWEYNTKEEVYSKMKSIEYGWVDQNQISHVEEVGFQDLYFQSPKELIASHIGNCWEQVELERFYFKNHIEAPQTYLLIYYKDKHPPTHTFLVKKEKGSFCWLEHAWQSQQGIHEYLSLEELLEDVVKKFIKSQLKEPIDWDYLRCYRYSKPDFKKSPQQFINHCESGENISLTNIQKGLANDNIV